jgi:uncharacterized protein YacL (UPF0231 family)
MTNPRLNPTTPDLRIVPTKDIFPHEQHDPQRSEPLIAVIRQATVLTNPPIVADIGDERFVILDGSNRYQTFSTLGYEHLLVQVVDYRSVHVELGVWQHVISHWEQDALLEDLKKIPHIEMAMGWQQSAIAQILLHDGGVWSLAADEEDIHVRNKILRQIVETYHHRAKLFRTVLTNPQEIWGIYPDAIALMMFPEYSQDDIIQAAVSQAYIPPGVSRHMIHGRALMVNYPLENLRDDSKTLEDKNKALKTWIVERFAERSVRYYAESTYLFNE